MVELTSYENDFKKFIPYLNDIGITTKKMIDRVFLFYKLCSNVCPDKIEDIFIEDYIKDDGTREYTDLNFHSLNYAMSAINFVNKIEFGITLLKNQITVWQIKAQDFDFVKATDKSRLVLYIKTIHHDGTFKASQNNCEYLQKMIDKFIKTNLVQIK